MAFEGKEGFGGPQELYDNVFVPLLIFHIILVVIGLIMAIYMIVLGFRSQEFLGGRRVLILGGQFGIEPLGAIVSGIGKIIARLKSQFMQPEGKVPYIFVVAFPGYRLPDPEFLFTDRHPVVTVSFGIAF